MKLGLISSAWFDTPLDGPAGAEQARELGFDTYDVFAEPGEFETDEARDRFVEGIRAAGLPIVQVSCVCLGLADFSGVVRRYQVERAKQIVDFATRFDAKNLLYVPGEQMWRGEILPPDREWKLTVEATKEIGAYAADKGVELAVEMMPPESSLVRDLDTLVPFLDAVDLDNVKALIDFSHMWLKRTPPEALERVRGRVAHAHISDCDGEKHGDLPPGRGNTPLLAYLEALRDIDFDGAVSVELEFSPDPAAMVEWVAEAYRETAKLMDEAGVRQPAAA